MSSLAACAGLLCAALWSLAASSAAALERADVSPDENPAVLALLEAADRDLDEGRPDDAALVVERALRIAPRNPTVWHYFGLARFGQGNYSQAEAMAAKSHSLASADRSLRTRNAGLMASAQQAAGKPVSVPSDEPPVSAWDRLFAEEPEPAVTYADSDAAPQPDRAAPARGWRQSGADYAARMRERAAAWRDQTAAWRDQQAQRSRSIIVFDGYRYRRYAVNEGNRRRR